MNTIEERRITNKISDEILELVDQAQAMDRSDTQAATEAIAIKLVKQYCKREDA